MTLPIKLHKHIDFIIVEKLYKCYECKNRSLKNLNLKFVNIQALQLHLLKCDRQQFLSFLH